MQTGEATLKRQNSYDNIANDYYQKLQPERKKLQRTKATQNLFENEIEIDSNQVHDTSNIAKEIFLKLEEPPSKPLVLINDNSEIIIDSRITKLFGNHTLSKKEINLFLNNENFQKKLNKEKQRIQNQVIKENLKLNLKELQEKTSSCTSISSLENVQSYNGCFISQCGTRHLQNEDTLQMFELKIGQKTASCFSIFDGHGGSFASEFCRDHIQDSLKKCLDALSEKDDDFEIANAIKMSFVLLDSSLETYRKNSNGPIKAGCAAILALIFEKKLFVANCGDCRAILILDELDKTEQLSFDFKASEECTKKSVNKRGGNIHSSTFDCPRVNGQLAITRAIGDEYLRQTNGLKPITSRPKIMIKDLANLEKQKNIQLLICSDGLTDMLTTRTLANAVHSLRGKNSDPLSIVQALLKEARERKANDDITIGLIDLENL